MSSKFATGKYAIAFCDRCGFRTKLKELRPLVIKGKVVGIKVCRECWEPDHPQLHLGEYPVNDPQALRDPRRDTTLPQSRAFIDQVQIGVGLGIAIGIPIPQDPGPVLLEDGFVFSMEGTGNIMQE